MIARLRVLWANSWIRWPVNLASVVLMVPFVFWLAVKFLSADEPLRDEIDAVLLYERPAEDPGNAYYALLGITAPDSADSHRVGTLAVMVMFDKIENGQPADRLSPVVPGGDALPLAAIPSPCTSNEDLCLPQMRANVALATAWEKAHGLIWKRYLDATQLPRYADTERGAEQVASRLTLLSAAARSIAAQRWARGQQPQAIEIVDRSVALCRRVLAGTVALATKLAARRCVAGGWQLATAFALDVPPAAFKRIAPPLRKIAPPLAPDELAFAAIVRAETRSSLPTILDLPEGLALTQSENPWLDALLRPFFQRNATLNRYFESTIAQVALDRLPNAELAARAVSRVDAHWWPRLRSGNPIGLWLLDFVPRDALVPHMLNVRALESQRLLLLLVLQCAGDGVLPKHPAACASAAPGELRNPFDGSAPLWDEGARTLSFPVPSAAYREQLQAPVIRLAAR